MSNQFKELGRFSKFLQLEKYIRCYKLKDLPEKSCTEILIVGKSNVGKSTLINTLINHNITKTSRNPGCTKWIGFLKLRKIALIDLPGYGFANVSKGRKEFWNKMVHEYIDAKRADLVFVLVDSRKGIQQEDIFTAQIFNRPVIFLYTKSDLNSLINKQQNADAIPENTIAVSAKKGHGIDAVRSVLASLSNDDDEE